MGLMVALLLVPDLCQNLPNFSIKQNGNQSWSFKSEAQRDKILEIDTEFSKYILIFDW